MHVDATGADGTKFCPYYLEDTSSGGDALKFDNLKTKNTFVKIHGWGRIIFQSYSDIETQGSNLILDVIFRALKIYTESKALTQLRNLYVFLDNTNPNKSHTLIGGLACLVLLGKFKRYILPSAQYLTVFEFLVRYCAEGESCLLTCVSHSL